MVMFSGINTVADMRNASRQKKADAAAVKTPTSKATPATDKPVTNTSGSAKPKGAGAGTKQLQRQIEFGQKFGDGMGAVAGFMGMPFMSKIGGKPMTVDTVNQQIVQPGSVIKPAASTTAKKVVKTPATSGIDAPAPDTGWRPSGVNSALGLQQTTMGVPLQETIGVSKRKR